MITVNSTVPFIQHTVGGGLENMRCAERIALSMPAGNVSFPVLPQSGQQRADRPQQACWQRLISCPTTERAAVLSLVRVSSIRVLGQMFQCGKVNTTSTQTTIFPPSTLLLVGLKLVTARTVSPIALI